MAIKVEKREYPDGTFYAVTTPKRVLSADEARRLLAELGRIFNETPRFVCVECGHLAVLKPGRICKACLKEDTE